MKRFVGLIFNEPVFTVSSLGETYSDGDVLSDGTVVREFFDGSVGDSQIVDNYIWVNGWAYREKKPSDSHEWNVESLSWGVSITKLKEKKSQEVSVSCEISIVSGYESYALGILLSYPSLQTDQMNMVASVTDSYNPTNGPNWKTLFWCKNTTGVWEYLEHTAQQIQKAGSDGKAHITSQLIKNATLQGQILAATTQEQLDLIVW